MKKKITLLLGVVCIACTLSAQNVLKLADFEDGVDDCFLGSSGSPSGINFAGSKAVIENPYPDAEHGASKVLEVVHPAASTGAYYVLFSNAIGSNTVTSESPVIPIGTDPGQYRYLHLKLLKSVTSRVEWQFRNSGGTGQGYCSIEVAGNGEWQSIVMDLMNEGANCNVPSIISGGAIFYGYMLCIDRGYVNTGGFTVYIDDIYLSDSDETPIATNINNKTAKKSGISVVKNQSGSAVLVDGVTGNLKLEVFNLQGQLIKEVYKGAAASGSYELPSLTGIYILKATSAEGVTSIKF